ncbi:sigma-70 family RNA polymerase sigma factor [Leifsonia poae]|uniref:sigma-70 family RNA polymerase sigma factor n=1 Tax=Leifsonia poae TaxID=110933 RepID=UPI001CC13726|nr:sigma-70 family RNA polymerase sigma factor [Leifsonia poae]
MNHNSGPADPERSDAELVELTRAGDREAFAELWRRHARAGLTVARSFTSTFDADDLISEAYAKIYQAIAAGKGPTTAFRAYLFTTIRNIASSWGRARHETPIDDAETIEDPAFSEASTIAALDRSLTATAFRSLPTRWQEVLWYCEVEAMSPQDVAPLLGMKANAVAALAYRAREGLRQAWIQAHIAATPADSDCRWTTERLGAYARKSLGKRDTAKLEDHLASCAKCTIVAAEAHEVGSRLALVLLPLTVGVGGAAAYAAWTQTGANSVSYALGASGAVMPASATGHTVVATGAASTGTGTTGVGSATSASHGATGSGSGSSTAGLTITGLLVAAAIVGGVVFGPQLYRQFFEPTSDVATASGDNVPAPETPQQPKASPAPTATPPSAPPVPTLPVVPVVAPTAPRSAPTPATIPPVAAPPTTAPPTTPPIVPPVTPPAAPAVTSPAADANITTAAHSLDASGTAVPDATITVTAVSGRTRSAPITVGITKADAAGRWGLTLDLSALTDGPWTVSFVQTTADGASAAQTRNLTIDRSVGAPVISAVDTGSDASADLLAPIVSGTAAPGATVRILDNGTLQTTVTADGSGAWITPELTGVSPDYALTAEQTDGLGNVSPASAATTGHIQTATLTADGATGKIALTVQGQQNATVRIFADGNASSYTLPLGADGIASNVYDSVITGPRMIGVAYIDGARRGLLVQVPIVVA